MSNAALQRRQRSFILWSNDVPELRALFVWARIETIELSYQARARGTRRVREPVITKGIRG